VGSRGEGVGDSAGKGEVRDGGGGRGKGDFVRQVKDFAIQSMSGFSFSRKGIPRIMDWTPMLATKKVCCIETFAIE
jgi:hypothetical protein